MTLTILIDAATRAARLREVDALAAGDLYDPLYLDGVPGADLGTLSVALYRDATMARLVALASAAGESSDDVPGHSGPDGAPASPSGFRPVPGHRRVAAGAMSMGSAAMEDWFLAATPLGESSDSSEGSGDPERSVRTDGWLVVADASRTWAACRVPVVLRDVAGRGTLPGSSVAGIAAAAAEAAVASLLASKADLSGGVVPLSQLPASSLAGVSVLASRAAFPDRPAAGDDGKLFVAADDGSAWRWTGSSYARVAPAPVESVNGMTGAVVLPPAPAPVQADWEESSSGDPAFVRNKPPAPVQADWAQADSSDPSYVRNKPDVSRVRPDWAVDDPSDDRYVANRPDLRAMLRAARPDWAVDDPSDDRYIANRPEIPDARTLQADWTQEDPSAADYIRHRPAPGRVRPDWDVSDPSDDRYIFHRPAIPVVVPQVPSDWGEGDPSSPAYIANKPDIASVSARAEEALRTARARQARLGPAALAVLDSGLTAERLRYLERAAAASVASSGAGYPFVAAAAARTYSGWSFAAAVPGLDLGPVAAPAPAWSAAGARWLRMPYEEGAFSSDDSLDVAESGDGPLPVLTYPRGRAWDAAACELAVLENYNGAGSPPLVDLRVGAALSYPDARVLSRRMPGGETAWYCHYRSSGGSHVWSDEFRSLAEIEAAAAAGLPVLCYRAPCSESDSDEPDFSGWTGGYPLAFRGTPASAADVLSVDPWTVAAFSPSAPLAVVAGDAPAGMEGRQRDMFLVLDCESESGSGGPFVAWGPEFEILAPDAAPRAGETNVYRLTEHAPGAFSVSRVPAGGGGGGGGGGSVQADWEETNSSAPGYVRNKPAIPAVDATLSTQGAAADAKAAGDALAAKADAADLPYALVLVTPGEWSFSGVPTGWTASVEEASEAVYLIIQENGGEGYFEHQYDPGQYDDLTADLGGNTVTATRNHLLDRAVNRVEVTGATTLVLPAAVSGRARDFLVRLDLTALATAPEVTFAAPTGETVTFETEDGAMPELEAGKVNLVSFTETAAGMIDVAHKVMQEVE